MGAGMGIRGWMGVRAGWGMGAGMGGWMGFGAGMRDGWVSVGGKKVVL